MGSRYHDRTTGSEEQLGQKGGKRDQRDVALCGGQHLHMVAPAHVAHHHAFGGPVEIRGPETFHHCDVLLAELGRHGWIHMLVGTTHLVASGAQKPSQGTHTRSGDANQVQFHRLQPSTAENLAESGKQDKIGPLSNVNRRLSTVDSTGAHTGDPAGPTRSRRP